MTKLFLVLAAAALAFIAAADATRYTVTTSIVEESSSNPRSDCRQQIQRQEFRGCERYMSDGNRRDLNRCCQELDRLPDRCEREALRDIMRHQQQHTEGREEMMERAREIESSCHVGSSSLAEVEAEESEEEQSNPRSDCRQQIQRQEFRGCERYMTDGNRKDLNRCCQELDHLPDRCEKEALRDIMRHQQQHTEGREEMMQRAREIESTCGVGSSSSSSLAEAEIEESEEGEESNPSGSCREQVQMQELKGCERFVRSGDRSRDLNRCCREMERIDDRCQREAMREIMRHQGGGGSGGYGMREMEERAREVMRSCGRGGGYGSSLIRMIMGN